MKRIRVYGLTYQAIFSGFILFCAYFLIWSDIGLLRYYSVKRQIGVRKREFLALRQEMRGIEGEVAKWESNPFYLVKMAREELGMGYPDEKVYFYRKK